MKYLIQKFCFFFWGKIRPKSPAEKMCEDLEMKIECLQSTIKKQEARLFAMTLKYRNLTRMVKSHIKYGRDIL